MKRRYFSGFVVGCCVYIVAVSVAFAFGVAESDTEGVSFLPAALLTSPWFFIPESMHLPEGLFSALTAFYDFPLFLVSALLNIVVVYRIRRFFLSKRKEQPPQLGLRH